MIQELKVPDYKTDQERKYSRFALELARIDTKFRHMMASIVCNSKNRKRATLNVVAKDHGIHRSTLYRYMEAKESED